MGVVVEYVGGKVEWCVGGGRCMCDECEFPVLCFDLFFFLMIRRRPRSTQSRSSAASDVYKRQKIYFF